MVKRKPDAWIVVTDTLVDGEQLDVALICSQSGDVIAYLPCDEYSKSKALANARLIAEAPTMRRLLREVLSHLDLGNYPENHDLTLVVRIQSTLDRAEGKS